MKKILTIALVALLAASTAFAGLSGKATLSLGYDTASKSYGFDNGNSFTVDLDLDSETAENAQEGDIVAGAKASLAIKVANSNYYTLFAKDDAAKLGIGAILSLDEAYVKGQDWKVSITGTQSGPDFAKSAIDSVVDDTAKDAFGAYKTAFYWNIKYKAKSWKISTFKAPGVTATYKDWSVALGLNGGEADPYLDKDGNELVKQAAFKYDDKKVTDYSESYKSGTGAPKFFNYHFSVFTPSLELAEGFTVKAAAVASAVKNATKAYVKDAMFGTAIVKGYEASENYDAFGASVEGAYASDAFSGKLDVDFGMKKTVGTDKFALGLDVAANAVVSGFTVDAYYQYGEKAQWISAQLTADLNTFDVPVVVKAYGKDILTGKKLGGEVSATVDAFTATVGGSYTLSTKEYGVSGSVEYKTDMFTAKAGLNFDNNLNSKKVLTKQLYANASVESDALVPGATLALEYGPNINSFTEAVESNFLSGTDKGAVSATCTIKF